MLPVSTVYIAWRHGDMVDAYYSCLAQVIFMQRVSSIDDGLYMVLIRHPYFDCRFQWVFLHGTEKLEIREDVEGIAA